MGRRVLSVHVNTRNLLRVCVVVCVAWCLHTILTVCLRGVPVSVPFDVMHNVTLFSLVSSNSLLYCMHTLLLYRSVYQFVPRQELHLLVTDDVSPVIIRALDVFANTHLVSPYPGEPTAPHPNDTHISKLRDSWVHQLSKVKLWSMNISEVVCYLDSDMIFFGHDALQGVVSECLDGFSSTSNIEWCGFDTEDPNGNDAHWGIKTIQANFFCLKPNAALFARMEREIVHTMTQGRMFYKGMYVATEQDIMNLFFDGKIHFVKKRRPNGGRFHHSNWNFWIWVAWDVGLEAFIST